MNTAAYDVDDVITVNGKTYRGLHAICYATSDERRAEHREQLAKVRAEAGADAEIGRAVRRLLLPGVKRRTWRREELQAIVDAADTRHAPP